MLSEDLGKQRYVRAFTLLYAIAPLVDETHWSLCRVGFVNNFALQ